MVIAGGLMPLDAANPAFSGLYMVMAGKKAQYLV
jgi:hypothetical protein